MKTLLNIGHGRAQYIVETEEVARVLAPHVAQAKDEYDGNGGPKRDPGIGPLTYIAEEVARRRATTPEAMFRRLYGIRYGETNTTNADLAEHFLIVVGEGEAFKDLPVFPAGKQAAREMADVWCEDWPETDRARFASTLLHFAQGFFSVDLVEESDTYTLLAADVAASVAA